MKSWKKALAVLSVAAAAGYAYWKLAIPTHRVSARSELVMLGDLDGDGRWGDGDRRVLSEFLSNPVRTPDEVVGRLDLNRNGLVDEEDLRFLQALVRAGGDPYAAAEAARAQGQPFPRPREFYRYITVGTYQTRPLWALPSERAGDSVLPWLAGWPPQSEGQGRFGASPYARTLHAAIYAEAVRFDMGWRQREAGLLPVEREYAARKIGRTKDLAGAGDLTELLLALIELVEDAETLTTRGQPELLVRLLALRDHLRGILGSSEFADFQAGRRDWRAVLKLVSDRIREDVGLTYDFETLAKPRNLTNLENYIQRAEWQYYKSSTREEDFRALIDYAQHDPRYLQAVSRTRRRLQDINVENHNLPMVLLFREALRIQGGDKKKAVGLLDEAIRIPYAWVKGIPREALPSSLALDNFLLPGNKEDGADKSRHWNVFGGICLYKSPEEALDLAVKREMQDLREAHYSADAMREFLRDLIANLNGMFHVMAVNPELLTSPPRAIRP